MSELKINNVSVLTESGGTVTAQNMGFSANDAGIKTALNASGDAGISACRAWVNFNGTLDENSGSLTAGENILIRASFNVSSVYYNGAGDYTVNFATAMSDANYAVVATTKENNSTSVQTTVVMPHTNATGSCRFMVVRANVSVIDAENVNVTVFR